MNLTEPQDCKRFSEFKNFLHEQVSGAAEAISNAPSFSGEILRIRSSNETYMVTIEDLPAELYNCIWLHLQAKKCPRYFQMRLLRRALTDAGQECLNSKECLNPNTHISNVSESQFDLVKLQKFVINNLERLITRLTDNSQLGNLKEYAEPDALCKESEKCHCTLDPTKYAVGYTKNKPRKMEDRQVCLERFSELYQLKEPYLSFYGVFDGHSGSLAACYSATQLPYLLAERLKADVDDLDDVHSVREAFESAFLHADEMFIQKHIISGTTAVCALIAHHPDTPRLFVAWVGDSKALLVSTNTRLQLVHSHKPDSPDERRRIESSGGTVMFVQGQWRVNGILNVSRSIGDYSVSVSVIAEPDFVDVPLTKDHDFLVLGTDGLWDHVDESTIVMRIYNALADPEQQLDDIPKMLMELAKEGDSQDNITVVVVLLQERSQIVDGYKNALLQNTHTQLF